MIDADEFVRAEVDRLLPPPGGFGADWATVLARAAASRPTRAHRRLTLLIAGLLVAVVCAGIAFGATVWLAHGPDQILPIASGRDWSLVAHRKNGHLCISYGSPGVGADGCRFPTPRALSIFLVAPTAGGQRRLVGLVAPNVARVEATAQGHDPVRARVYPLPAFFASPLRMFVAELPATNNTLTAYGANGRPLGTIRY